MSILLKTYCIYFIFIVYAKINILTIAKIGGRCAGKQSTLTFFLRIPTIFLNWVRGMLQTNVRNNFY
jgi:hypothetical protein